MSYEFELKEQPEQPVLSTRARSAAENLPQLLGQVFEAVMQYLGELGEAPAGPPFVAYYNMDMKDLDLEIGFPVLHQLSGKGDIQSSAIPAGKYAACLYTGPYEEMGPAYEGLTKWVEEKGYEPSGISYEFYYNSPMEVPPAELKTQILFPLK